MYMQTPIYYATREGADNIVNLFIDNGADVNLEDKYGQICIYYAIKNGHESTTQLLLDNGADKNKVDKKKLSLYMFALRQNRPNIAELLIKNEVPVNPVAENNNNKKSLNKKRAKTDDLLLTGENNNNNNSNNNTTVPNVEDKIKKFVLVKFTEEGKVKLSEEDIEKFSKEFEDIYAILNDQNKLEELENEADSRLKNTEGWEKVAKKVINSVWKIKDAAIFHKPVDPIELNIPDYFTIIKNPMDFSTIKKRLNSGLYTNFKEFDDDVRLVFYNCILYNGDKSYVGSMCLRVKNEYEKLYDQNNLGLFI